MADKGLPPAPLTTVITEPKLNSFLPSSFRLRPCPKQSHQSKQLKPAFGHNILEASMKQQRWGRLWNQWTTRSCICIIVISRDTRNRIITIIVSTVAYGMAGVEATG